MSKGSNKLKTRKMDAGQEIVLGGSGSRGDRLYEYLRKQILHGVLMPGERLVEDLIASRASVSRTPVREALHRLEMDGLVTTKGRSIVVTDFSPNKMAELCAVREVLEGFAARLASAGASEMELDICASLVESYSAAVDSGDTDQQIEINHSFHETIWAAAHNEYLSGQLETLRALIERRGTTTLASPERQAETLEEHRAIYEALTSRNAEAAEEATRAHFRKAMTIRLILERNAARR